MIKLTRSLFIAGSLLFSFSANAAVTKKEKVTLAESFLSVLMPNSYQKISNAQDMIQQINADELNSCIQAEKLINRIY